MSLDLSVASACAIAKAIRSRQLSARDAADACLARMALVLALQAAACVEATLGGFSPPPLEEP